MRFYREAMSGRAQIEQTVDENVSLRAEVARLKMELSLAHQARANLEQRVAVSRVQGGGFRD